jgi:pimeloyl-ACP methyl ester carboxylesterase
MPDRIVVLGGWGISPCILKPVFGENAVYVDTNILIANCITQNRLIDNWQYMLRNFLQTHYTIESLSDIALAGWSTGAIIASGIAQTISPRRLILLSATPSFCRRTGFKFGTKPSVLHAMKAGLRSDAASVMKNFYLQCGLSPTGGADTYSTDALCDGLTFLEQVNLLPLIKMVCPTMLLHGIDDAVVPVDAGRLFNAQCNGTFFECKGPHAFFMNQADTLRTHIDKG